MRLPDRNFGQGHWHRVELHEADPARPAHIAEYCMMRPGDTRDCIAPPARDPRAHETVRGSMAPQGDYCPACQ